MDPNQPYPGPTQNGQYEFILAPPKPSRKLFSFGGLGNHNFGLTIGLIISGAIILMIVLALLASALGSSNHATINSLIGLVQTQDELVHISTEGENGAVQQTTKNLAITVEYSLTTQEQGTVKLLASNGTKVGTKQLKLKESAATDQQLTNATANSTFDSVFVQVLQQQLAGYMGALKQLNTTTKGQAIKNLTYQYYQQSQLLSNQIPYVQNQIKASGQ